VSGAARAGHATRSIAARQRAASAIFMKRDEYGHKT